MNNKSLQRICSPKLKLKEVNVSTTIKFSFNEIKKKVTKTSSKLYRQLIVFFSLVSVSFKRHLKLQLSNQSKGQSHHVDHADHVDHSQQSHNTHPHLHKQPNLHHHHSNPKPGHNMRLHNLNLNLHQSHSNTHPLAHHNNHQQQQQQQQQQHSQHQQNPMSKFLSQIIPQQNYKLVSDTPEWKKLSKHAEYIQTTHLRDLLQDANRCDALYAEHDGVYFDYSRQRITLETMDLLLDLAERQNLKEKMDAMVNGEKINFTEDRAVLHTALRGRRPSPKTNVSPDSKLEEGVGQEGEGEGKGKSVESFSARAETTPSSINGAKEDRIIVDGDDVMEEVYDVLDQIKYFTEAVRSGEIRGFTGKRLRNIISVGIGGSYLGPEFLHECLKTEPEGITKSLGYTLRFLSNVDPVDVERACADLDPEETLVVIVSKTFTTAETMLNARTVRQWLWDFMGDDKEVVRKHVVAVSSISSIEKVEAFGIDTEKYFFRFWDWVGGRYSVCSAVGGIPISLLYGFDLFDKFLQVRCFIVL